MSGFLANYGLGRKKEKKKEKKRKKTVFPTGSNLLVGKVSNFKKLTYVLIVGNKCQLFSNSLTQTKITSYQVGRKTNVFLLEWFIWASSCCLGSFFKGNRTVCKRNALADRRPSSNCKSRSYEIKIKSGVSIYILNLILLPKTISGPYFPVFSLNTEIYTVNLRIQFEYRKMQTRKNSIF